jgi:hypothetical protein
MDHKRSTAFAYDISITLLIFIQRSFRILQKMHI